MTDDNENDVLCIVDRQNTVSGKTNEFSGSSKLILQRIFLTREELWGRSHHRVSPEPQLSISPTKSLVYATGECFFEHWLCIDLHEEQIDELTGECTHFIQTLHTHPHIEEDVVILPSTENREE